MYEALQNSLLILNHAHFMPVSVESTGNFRRVSVIDTMSALTGPTEMVLFGVLCNAPTTLHVTRGVSMSRMSSSELTIRS